MAVHLAEQWLFVGGSTGKICRINLYTKVHSVTRYSICVVMWAAFLCVACLQPMGPDIGEGKMHYTGHRYVGQGV